MTANPPAEQAQHILEHAPFPLVILDGDERIVSYNLAFEALLTPAVAAELNGRDIGQLTDHPAQTLFSSASQAHWSSRGGERRHYRITTIALAGGCARLYTDITRQVELEGMEKKLQEDLRKNILTDAVTGLLNQRGLLLALEPQVARSRRYNNPMSVIMMDVNADGTTESYRHLAVARMLKDQLRWADLIGCSPHDEFILILPETSPEAAASLAKKLTRLVGEVTAELGGSSPVVSYGITGWRRSDSASSLIARAAAALSQARSAESTHAIAL